MDTFITVIEIIGTIAFSVSGAMTAIEKKMDIFGVMFLGVVTAVGGGILRDVMIGYTPPQCFRSPEYINVSLICAFMFFLPFVNRILTRNRRLFDFVLFLMDSAGLAIFTVVGIMSAESFSSSYRPVLLICVGMLTGTGGGVLRDVLAGNTPYIFVKHIYATASIIGALCYLTLEFFSVNRYVSVIISIAAIFIVRCLSAHFKWNLPKSSGTTEI